MLRNLWFTIPPWINVVLAIALVPVTWYIGGALELAVGTASLGILAIPTCLAALRGDRTMAVMTAFVAVCGCILEAGFALGHGNVAPDWAFVMLAIGVQLGLSGTILGLIPPLEAPSGLDPQTAEYLRELYERRDTEGNEDGGSKF